MRERSSSSADDCGILTAFPDLDAEVITVLKHALFVLAIWLAPAAAFGQSSIAGDWVLTQDIFGNQLHQRMTLRAEGPTVSGTVGRRQVDGSLAGSAIRLTVKGGGGTDELTGTLAGDSMSGTLVHT